MTSTDVPRPLEQTDRTTPRAVPATRLRTVGGWAAVVGAIAAIAGNALVLAATPNAPTDALSYPLSAHDFRLGQIFFTATQALMALGIIALAFTALSDVGRRARAWAALAAVGSVAQVVGEVILAVVAATAADSPRANLATTLFGLGVVVSDVGLIGIGVLAHRTRAWGRPGVLLPILVGAVQLFVVTPVVMGFGFASVAAFAAIAAQDALIAVLGWCLARPGGLGVPNRAV